MNITKFMILALVLISALIPQTIIASEIKKPVIPVTVQDLSSFAAHGFFYVGGEYAPVAEGKRHALHKHMYVEVYVPKDITKPYPLVLIHGLNNTGANWMSTAEGGKSWMHYFVEHGYVVYVVDQPGRGRSGYIPELDGKLIHPSPEAAEANLTATAKGKIRNDWPQAAKHTQWPGSGQRGDATFDQLFARHISSMASTPTSQAYTRDAGRALLDKIGPAILVTHSQAGPMGWLIADGRPKLVKGIVALEPSGPPLKREGAKTAAGAGGAWGLAHQPLTYAPAIKDSNELQFELHKPRQEGELSGYLQKEPARQLVNLIHIPILIITAEASYHAPYDAWTSRYLTQAGVKNDFVELAKVGQKGNGHMMMYEKNSLEIAKIANAWIEKNVK